MWQGLDPTEDPLSPQAAARLHYLTVILSPSPSLSRPLKKVLLHPHPFRLRAIAPVLEEVGCFTTSSLFPLLLSPPLLTLPSAAFPE